MSEDQYRALWKRVCFHPDGTPTDEFLPYQQWKELRFEPKKRVLSQGKSAFSENDLTPR